MGAMKTAENGGKRAEKTHRPTPLQRISDPPARRGPVALVFYWAIGLTVGAIVTAVAICTVLVYKQRLETLQSRVDVLEQQYFDVETNMKNYVEERLRTILLQVSTMYSLYPIQCFF